MPTLEQILPESDREYLDRVATLRTCATLPGPPSRIPRPDELNAHFKKLVASWVPHPFSPEEREQVRREGLRYLIIAHKIQEVQRDIHPRRLPAEIESQLAFAKQSYLLRFWRIFRINDLPPEILLNILRFVVWDSFRTPVPARLQLTATCHPWRELLLADSTVWNAIWFRGDLGPRHDRAWAWFERARQSLLDVRIDTDANVLSGDEQPSSVLGPDQMRILLHRLFEKLSTIRMLIVTTDDWESALVVLELLSKYALVNGAPHLERFELHRGGLKNEDRKSLTWPKLEAQPFLAGMHPPSLTYLSLNGIPVDWAGSVLQNLTTLDMRRLPATYSPDLLRFREILLNCPRLVKLSMDGAGPKFEEYYVHNPLPAIDLPELMTLVLADFTLPYAQYCVAQLTAPNVNDLTLMNLCGEDYLPLFRQMTGMFPKVQLLTTYSIQFNPAFSSDMVRWLDSMPILAYLRVANVATLFFSLFFRESGAAAPVAPRLVVLDASNLDVQVVVKFAYERRTTGTQFRKIYLSEDMGKALDSEQHAELSTYPTSLSRLPRGATTPEETALSRTAERLSMKRAQT